MRLAIVVLAACSSPAAPVSNTTKPKSLPELPRDEVLGVLAVAPITAQQYSTHESTSWIPTEEGTTAIVPNKEGMVGPGWRLYDSKGVSIAGRFLPVTKIPYGCDKNQLEVTPFQSTDTTKLQPGLAWILREHVTLAPKPVAIWGTSDTSADARSYVIGNVGLQLVRTDPNRGTLAISWQGRRLHVMPIERSEMAGADMSQPIDFTAGGVAVPVPEAAWKFGNDGAVLLVLRIRGYEGTSFTAVVINDHAARVVDRMSTYLYHCAF